MLPDEFTSLEDAVSAYVQAREDESSVQFRQSDIAARACIEKNRQAWGMSDEQILDALGKTVEHGRTTMYSRLLVGRVFPKQWREDNIWCTRKFWSHFEVCARTWSEADPGAPEAWLRYCVDHDLSVRQLKLEIQAAGGDVPDARPVYLFEAVTVTLDALDDRSMTVYFATPPNLGGHVEPGTQIVLTAVLEREPEPVLVQTFA